MSSLRNSPCAPSRRRTERGSAVITVLVLAAITAVISSSFLFRSIQEAKLATRSYYQSVVLNLAEAGIEEGFFAANTSAFTTANGWSLVSGSTTSYKKTITTGLAFEQGTGSIYVRVDNATSLTPIVLAAGRITILNQPAMAKQLRVAATKRRLWGNGMVSKGHITFSGNTAIDSYSSTVGVYNAASNRTDQATVASNSTDVDPIVVGSNSTIYGYVATTGADPVVGTNGRIYGATTPSATLVDSTRVRRDFTANLPDVSAPTTTAISLAAVTTPVSLPRVGDVAGANGRYLYTTTGVTLAGSEAFTITGPVDVIVTGNVAISGNAYFNISGSSTTSSLNLYSPGTIALGGNGVVNGTSKAAKMTVWGTAPSSSSQSVSITGNGEFIGTIYAPNAALHLAGNGATSGAVIGGTITISGNGNFHYDTDLASVETTVDTSFRVTAWTELTAAAGSGAAFARDNTGPFAGIF
jgi:hypothetical protein